VNVGQRAGLYKTIARLERAGLVAVRQTERDQRFPERTVYELTDAGRRQGRQWLEDMLASPRNEFPRFPAALAFAMLLGPRDLVVSLEPARPPCANGWPSSTASWASTPICHG
jgi:hypothetical protein